MGEFNCLQCLQSQQIIDYTLNNFDHHQRSLLATMQKGCVFTQKMFRFFDQLIRFNQSVQSVVVLERSRTRFKKFQTDQRVFFAILEILTIG